MSSGQIKNRLDLMNDTLLEIKKLLDELGIRFYLMAGTLLGIIREDRLLPWDNDIDIGLLADYKNKKLREAIYDRFTEAGFSKIFIKGPDKYGLYCLACHGRILAVSLQFVRELEDGKFKAATVPIFWPRRFFKKMKKVEYLGKKFLVPTPPEEYLDINFGKTWRIRAMRMRIVPNSNPIKLYEPLPYHKVYLKCDKNGILIEPFESIGFQKD